MEKFPGKGRNLLVNLHTCNLHVPEILPALGGIGTRTHAQNQHPAVLRGLSLHHQRRGHGIIVVHARESLFLHVNGLDAEQYIGGKNDTSVIFFYLEIIVHGLPLIGQIIFPEGKAVRISQNTAHQIAQKGSHRLCHSMAVLFPGIPAFYLCPVSRSPPILCAGNPILILFCGFCYSPASSACSSPF